MADRLSPERAILGNIRGHQHGDDDAEVIAAELSAIGEAPAPNIPQEAFLKHFLQRLKRNEIEVQTATGRSEAVKRIARFIYAEHNSYRAVAGFDGRLAAMPWRDGGVLLRFGVATADDPVCISYAHCGVAETGSLLLYSNRDNPAANTWLCRHHIVLMEAATLVGTLEDAWAVVRQHTGAATPQRGTHLISGPSGTGDIARHMVTGAHGPQRLIVILLGHLDTDLLEDCGYTQPPIPE